MFVAIFLTSIYLSILDEAFSIIIININYLFPPYPSFHLNLKNFLAFYHFTFWLLFLWQWVTAIIKDNNKEKALGETQTHPFCIKKPAYP